MKSSQIELISQSDIPTTFGSFSFCVFKNLEGTEVMSITKGEEHFSCDEVFTRIHSSCMTSEVFHSLKCDCNAQLQAAMKEIQSRECGILIYLFQEGRGIGLANKIKAYALQNIGLDTYEANKELGFEHDQRNYKDAIDILNFYQIKKVLLNTNNPKKIAAIESAHIKIEKRIPSLTEINEYNEFYLKTKKESAGHLLDLS